MKHFLISFLACGALTSQCLAGFSTETAPYQPSGKIDGFKVMIENPKSTKLIAMGVHRNDVVIAVNGKPIQSLKDAQQAYSEQKVREVAVLRDEKMLTLTSKGGRQ
jgi:S1-C subfamily serine protease